MVTVPTEQFCFNIEDAIKHFARMQFDKSNLQEKVQQHNLLRFPKDLRGFSCVLCMELDTNDLSVFHSHVKNECGRIPDKIGRKAHLICYCRGCQVTFSLHISLGNIC